MKITIKKGKHSYFHLPVFHFGQPSVDCTVEFTESCLYDFPYPDRNQLNKLIGFSSGWHMQNSVRVGWNCRDGIIQLFEYVRRNGVMLPHNNTIRTIPVGRKVNIKINWVDEATVKIQINDQGTVLNRFINFPYSDKPGYYLFPYFGGQVPAPHNVSILMTHND